MHYFYIENGNQKGPLPLNELIKVISPDSMVWCQNMAEWKKASQVPEVAQAMGIYNNYNQQNFGNNNQYGEGFVSSNDSNDSNNYGSQQNYSNNYQQQYNNQQYNNQQQMGKRPDNYLTLCILSAVFCCNVLGIIGIIHSAKVNSLWAEGRYQEAQDASQKAKKFSIIAIVVGVVFWIIYLVFTIFASVYNY